MLNYNWLKLSEPEILNYQEVAFVMIQQPAFKLYEPPLSLMWQRNWQTNSKNLEGNLY